MGKKIRRFFLHFSIMVIITSLNTNAFSNAPKRILLVIMDGARYDYCTPETMPQLFSFMEKAMVFQNAYAPSSWTLPSHASLFTGLYPQQHGAFRLPYPPSNDVVADTKLRLEQPVVIDTIALPQEAITIADILHAAGYQTLGVFGNPCYGYPIFNLHKGFDRWENLVEEKLKATGKPSRGFYSFDYEVGGNFYTVIPDACEVAQTVSEVIEAVDPTRPIFLFINFEDPIGTPFYYPPQKRGEVVSNYPPYLKESMKKIDDVLPPILSFFKSGLIIVTSDHGQGDGTGFKAAEHGSSLRPFQTKIPLFIHNLALKGLNLEVPIDLTRIMDVVLAATGLAHPDKKIFFYPHRSAAFSHLDHSPNVPIGTMASYGTIISVRVFSISS